MSVKLRLQRKGRKRAPYYHIVVADARAPRDGKYIERLGFYNPMTKPASIEIDRDLAFKWLMNGAQPTDTVRAILRFKGVLYKKHLHQGVLKGALTPEQAEEKFNAWIANKEQSVASRVEQTKEERAAQQKAIFGEKKVVAKPVVEEAQEEVQEPSLDAVATEETTLPETTVQDANEQSAPVEEINSTEAEASNPSEGSEESTEEEKA
jgi:small subunit ribosomal protein S16